MSVPTRSAAPCALPGTPLADVRAGIDACVHCGFCLEACPTYGTLENENDSPRGRILLMRAALEGTLPLQDPSIQTHIDRCLGCRACETACPSGVPYGQLLEATRATLNRVRPLPRVARVILAVFSRPVPLRAAMFGARVLRALRVPELLSRLPGRAGFAMAMLGVTRSPLSARRYPVPPAAERGSATLLTGCVMAGLYDETNRAATRTLAVNGYSCTNSPGQRCCGALHAHAGDLDGARSLARVNIAAFERSGADYVAVTAAGCGATMKEYEHLLAADPEWRDRAANIARRVRDITELLAAAGPARGGPIPARVAYDAPCHLIHAQRVSDPPLTVLGAIDGLQLVPLPSAERCCGSAGIYSLVEPGISRDVLEPKLREIESSGAQLVATGNPGCLMQIGAGLRLAGSSVRAVHPVELLDAAYAAKYWSKDGRREASSPDGSADG